MSDVVVGLRVVLVVVGLPVVDGVDVVEVNSVDVDPVEVDSVDVDPVEVDSVDVDPVDVDSVDVVSVDVDPVDVVRVVDAFVVVSVDVVAMSNYKFCQQFWKMDHF